MNTQFLYSNLGKRYKLYFDGRRPDINSAVGASIKPLAFTDHVYTKQFIRTLSAPPSLWRKLASTQITPVLSPERDQDIEHKISLLFMSGKISVYELPDAHHVASSPKTLRTIKGKGKLSYEFAPASTLLTEEPTTVKSFGSREEVANFIDELGPETKELAELAKQLKIKAPSNQQADYTALVNLIAEEISKGNVVTIENTVNNQTQLPNQGGDESSAASPQDTQGPSLGPHAGEGGATAAVVQQAAEEEEPVCTLSQFTMKCSHGGRGYQLDVINDDPNFNLRHKVLRVVGKDDITISLGGSCAHGADECPALEISGNKGTKTAKGAAIKFTAEPTKPKKPVNSFGDFLRDWLLPDLPSLDYQTYTVKNLGCSDVEKHTAEVHCFPQMEWGGKVQLGYGTTSGDKKRKDQNLGEKAEWKFEAGLSGKIGDESWELKSGKSGDSKQYFPGMMDTLKDFIDKMDEIAESKTPKLGGEKDLGLVKFKLGWPQVAFGGKINLAEKNASTDVGIGGELALELSPLISADIRTDILDWLIGISGPHGPLLREIKKKAAEGVESKHVDAKLVVAVEIILNGSISGSFKWEKNPADKWLSTAGDKTGEAKLGLTIGLEAKVKVDTRVFFIKITMGAEFHMKGAENTGEGIGIVTTVFATTNADKPALGGNIKFTGCALYYTYYAEVGVKTMDSDERTRAQSGRRGTYFGNAKAAPNSLEAEAKGKEQKMKKLVTLLEARTWPADASQTNTSGITINEVKF